MTHSETERFIERNGAEFRGFQIDGYSCLVAALEDRSEYCAAAPLVSVRTLRGDRGEVRRWFCREARRELRVQFFLSTSGTPAWGTQNRH